MKKPTGRYAVTCKCCGKHWTADGEFRRGLYFDLGEFHHCEKFDAARPIVGSYQLGSIHLRVEPITHDLAGSQHKCGPKCRSARGPACECSCGGKNHGANWE